MLDGFKWHSSLLLKLDDLLTLCSVGSHNKFCGFIELLYFNLKHEVVGWKTNFVDTLYLHTLLTIGRETRLQISRVKDNFALVYKEILC